MDKRISDDELRNNYAHHAPANEDVAATHGEVRALLARCAVDLNNLVPEGRHKALMHTALEQARLWANTAVALAGSEGE